jgi:hypothetical protein
MILWVFGQLTIDFPDLKVSLTQKQIQSLSHSERDVMSLPARSFDK